jgi:DNA segregation ATPase FtsK/SpoIIIE-like protein
MPLSVELQRRLLAELFRLAAEREAAEHRREADYDQRKRRAEQEFRDAQQGASKRFRTDKESTEREYHTLKQRAVAESDAQIKEARDRLARLEAQLEGEFADNKARVKKELEDATWEANAIYESRRKGPKELVEQTEFQVADYIKHLEASLEDARNHIRACHFSRALELPPPEPSGIPPTDCAEQLKTAVEQTSGRLWGLRRLTIPTLFMGGRLIAIYVAILLLSIVPVLILFGIERLQWLGIAAGLAILACIVLTLWLRRIGWRQVAEAYSALLSYRAAGQAAGEALLNSMRSRAKQERSRLRADRDRELEAAKTKYEASDTAITQRRDTELAEARSEAQRIIRQATARRQDMLRLAEEKYPPLLEQIQTDHRTGLAAAQRQFDEARQQNERQYLDAWEELSSRWQTGMSQVLKELKALGAASEQWFPAWDDPAWQQWQPATTAPSAIRFGQLTVDLAEIPGGVSDSPALNEGIPASFEMPALLDFPRAGSLLVQAVGEGRDHGIDLVQAVMLRMLTTIPPGKVRFTIIDPVGLGENFAGFMHLADYDDVLVTSRIWTEPAHIEQRLADLTEQMENIIQKYLRNEFKTIEEYNAHAGEVAEAFRILVIANFPANFTEAAARRLVSIITSGARCGVYTLLLVDANQPLPAGFDLNDVAAYCTCLLWRDGSFIWRDADFRPFPLAVDRAPDEERFTQIVRLAGDSAKDSRRVEVPFDYIAPAEEKLWTQSTLHGFDIPLGRAGATKLQRMRLGQGTSQHVLVAGKTGSGKSTLLHALVTNMALTYSPDEVELYLIDFKKGVEFKTYATHNLPHARVVAIESEREFGLSVLARLDAELRRRGDLFRAAGVQDLAAYRGSNGSTKLARILLVIDEFHELFIEDDKIAQDAALLLDRLVRQGRAFGIHVLLGSQTLGGAYSIARSTIGQMGVRIALQCSEADAHMILSEENTAARLLSRPGEAIYNDAGGLIEGNNPFQVVWLSDERREQYLSKVREMAARAHRKGPRQIVFEGNAPAAVERNELLQALLASPAWKTTKPACTAWLGEPIAIKEPTSATFQRENGCNLLIVGQRDEAARGMMAAAILSVSAQRPAAESPADDRGVLFYILEAPRPDTSPDRQLSVLAGAIPHSLRVIARRDVPQTFDELAAEVERRQADDQGNYADVFVLIHDLARFRDLRQDESDVGFSFSSEAKRAGPDKQFQTVLRDGPSVGVFSIVWCDTLNNLTRFIDRQSMREFDMRVLFQMSQNDSSFLADTPVASKLGPHLAVIINEETAHVEKFRPYAWPDAGWLALTAAQLREAWGTKTAAGPLKRDSADELPIN